MPHDGETVFARGVGGFPTQGILGNLPLTYRVVLSLHLPRWWPRLGTNCLQSKWKKGQLVEVELGQE